VPPDRGELAASLERGVGWLEGNAAALLEERNAVLWWMVREASQATGDPRLSQLFQRWEARYPSLQKSIWNHLFDEASTSPLALREVEGLPYYDQFFFYGLTCDPRLGAVERIVRQGEADFCDPLPYRLKPACVTHQLMGLRFMQRRRCGDPVKVAAVVAHLQDRIVGQLTWDPRVVDVYLQRVVMLVESGARARVRPVWIRRVLAAQRPDGGWSADQPMVSLGSGRWLGFTQYGIGLARGRSNFHATAQGVWLMSLLLNPEGG